MYMVAIVEECDWHKFGRKIVGGVHALSINSPCMCWLVQILITLWLTFSR